MFYELRTLNKSKDIAVSLTPLRSFVRSSIKIKLPNLTPYHSNKHQALTKQHNTTQHNITQHNTTQQNKTKQNKTKQNKTKQNKTKQNTTKQNKNRIK